MAELYARGCAACSPDVAYALERMPQLAGYADAEAYWLLPEPRPHVFLDGEDMMKKSVVAIVPGADGWLLRNHLRTGVCADPTKEGLHLCACGSTDLDHEVWRGNVEMRQ